MIEVFLVLHSWYIIYGTNNKENLSILFKLSIYPKKYKFFNNYSYIISLFVQIINYVFEMCKNIKTNATTTTSCT